MRKESKRKLTDYGFAALCLCVMFLANTCANPFFPEKKVKGNSSNKANPSVTWPTGLTAADHGQTVSNIQLPGNGTSTVLGTFSWTTPASLIGGIGEQTHNMTFTPDDTDNYNTLTQNVNITVTAVLTDMVQVPSGAFTLGQELGGGNNHQGNQHSVTLSAYRIGKYQVTQEQYFAVMGTNPSYYHGGTGREPAAEEIQGKRPVEMVSWYDAIVFCNRLSIKEGLTPAYRIPGYGNSTDPEFWIASNSGAIPTDWNATWNAVEIVSGSTGYRLPTEAQWEYAAKGAGLDDYIYSGSNTVGDVAWYETNSEWITHEVGKKEPNGLGIYDMSGNVWEWCWDWYAGYTDEAKTDPMGAPSGSNRVVRGGSWITSASFTRAVYRYNGDPHARDFSLGFRLALPD
jgi:formylglycine-generating enzyme required for sulfatase activity